MVLLASSLALAACPGGSDGPRCHADTDCPQTPLGPGEYAAGECVRWACDGTSTMQYPGAMLGCVHAIVAAGAACTNGAAECLGTCPGPGAENADTCSMREGDPCHCYPVGTAPSTCTP